MAASAANGVARRTKTRVPETDSEPAPGNTPDASPPLAGWKVRRRQSVSTDSDASAPLEEVANAPSPPQGSNQMARLARPQRARPAGPGRGGCAEVQKRGYVV